MNRHIYALAFLFISAIIICIGVVSEETKLVTKQPEVKKYPPGIVLTFDDNYIEDWYKADNILHPYNWKATFFICKYAAFSASQKKQLHYLQKAGHDIAGHGYNHENALKFVAAHGLQDYINEEIVPLKAAMANDGFNIHSFAYPDGAGAHDTRLDESLMKYFNIIRGTTYGELPPDVQYCYYEGNRVIYGLGIDDDYRQFNLPYYKDLMLYAKEHNKIVIFYGHKTVDNADEKLETPFEALQQLCEFAVENGLKFYTVDDLSKLR